MITFANQFTPSITSIPSHQAIVPSKFPKLRTRQFEPYIQPQPVYSFYATTMTSPTVKLSGGHQMPLVGFGLWKVNNDTCADQVYNAIKTGYRLFDGACGNQHFFPHPPQSHPN